MLFNLYIKVTRIFDHILLVPRVVFSQKALLYTIISAKYYMYYMECQL